MSIAAPRPDESPAALETRLLDLFAPAMHDRHADDETRRDDRVSLWRTDAIHRAKNLAQLSVSLAGLVSHPSGQWPARAAAAPARSLARMYEELAADCGSPAPVPCFEMLSEVATRLTLIFGRARNIAIAVSGGEALAAPEIRRVLILMCSELVINALKHAFPAGRCGTISVTLRQGPGGIEMIVEDDGAGIAGPYRPGHGGGLLDRLAAIADATVDRGRGRGGAGLRVALRIPAIAAADGSRVAA